MTLPSPTQLGILALLAGGVGYAWYTDGRGQWYSILSERFLYGVPWGTLTVVTGVVGFYLFAQSGLSHWSNPVTLPFRTWSYFYPTGWLTAGFAHAGPDHLVGNMVGTVVLAPIAEYFWGHHPPSRTGRRDLTNVTAPPAEGWLARPWVRALVVFPGVVFAVSILTSVLSPGWSLGFSGTVFAFGGFVLLRYPVTTILAMAAMTVVSVLYRALTEPVLVETAGPGSPGPPSWFGINVFAHLLGFVVGVVLAAALVQRRDLRPSVQRVFAAALVFALARQLWLFTTSNGDVFRLHRGLGVVFALGLAILVTATVGVRDEPIPAPLADRRVPPRRQLAAGWVVVLTAGAGLALWGSEGGGTTVLTVAFLWAVLAWPALHALAPDRVLASPLSRQQLASGAVLVLGLLVVGLSVFSLAPVLDSTPEFEGTLSVEDYTVSYEEGTPDLRVSGVGPVPFSGGNSSGVVVVSDRRNLWSTPADPADLAHSGVATVPVGGVGWRDVVEANRTGWTVAGAGAAYIVDLSWEGEQVRSFVSDAVDSANRLDGHTVAVEPTQEGFVLNITREGTVVGTAPIPAVNGTVTVGDLQFVTEPGDDAPEVFAERGDTRVHIATRETY
ncbi:MAG: rhomboid family intramembrane serine protease [Halovenus sp.]